MYLQHKQQQQQQQQQQQIEENMSASGVIPWQINLHCSSAAKTPAPLRRPGTSYQTTLPPKQLFTCLYNQTHPGITYVSP
jgi:hypothetical protein